MGLLFLDLYQPAQRKLKKIIFERHRNNWLKMKLCKLIEREEFKIYKQASQVCHEKLKFTESWFRFKPIYNTRRMPDVSHIIL
jgi:hypothetical protein